MTTRLCLRAIAWFALWGPVSGLLQGGGTAQLSAVGDNTLFEYDLADENLALNSNGSGDFFSAGRSLNRNLMRRGLLQFDFATLPETSRVVAGSARLDLVVVNVPRQDPAPRGVWLTVAPQAWGEGTSAVLSGVGGSGSGAPASSDDATWYHTHYDPALHAKGPFQSGVTGYWLEEGALGDQPIDVTARFGPPAAIVPSQIGPVSLSGPSLEVPLNAWLRGTANFGWIVLGDETVTGELQSSLRSYASREHANEDYQPRLVFQYVISDLNGDDTIDAGDIAILFAAWGSDDPWSDLNDDQFVDAADVGLMFAEWTGDGLVAHLPEGAVEPYSAIGFALVFARLVQSKYRTDDHSCTTTPN